MRMCLEETDRERKHSDNCGWFYTEVTSAVCVADWETRAEILTPQK